MEEEYKEESVEIKPQVKIEENQPKIVHPTDKKLHHFLGKPRDPELKKRIAAAQKIRWDKYRAEKAAKEALEKQLDPSAFVKQTEIPIIEETVALPQNIPPKVEIKLNEVNILDILEEKKKETAKLMIMKDINNIKLVNRKTFSSTSFIPGTYLSDLAKKMSVR